MSIKINQNNMCREQEAYFARKNARYAWWQANYINFITYPFVALAGCVLFAGICCLIVMVGLFVLNIDVKKLAESQKTPPPITQKL